MQPTPIVPVVPAQGVPRTPPPASLAPVAPLPPPPDMSLATGLCRSTRKASVPAWHKDFAVGIVFMLGFRSFLWHVVRTYDRSFDAVLFLFLSAFVVEC